MRLTAYTDYSLRVLLYLAKYPNQPTTITELANFYQISRNHLVKVVHHLGLFGYIHTTRGRTGGISLAKLPADIQIGDVISATEPDLDLLECFNPSTDKCVITNACRLKGVLKKAQSEFLKNLNQYTLADLVRPSKNTHPKNFKTIPIKSK